MAGSRQIDFALMTAGFAKQSDLASIPTYVNGGAFQTVAELKANFPASAAVIGKLARVTDLWTAVRTTMICEYDGANYYWRPQRTDYAISSSQSSGTMNMIPLITAPNVVLKDTLLGNLTLNLMTVDAWSLYAKLRWFDWRSDQPSFCRIAENSRLYGKRMGGWLIAKPCRMSYERNAVCNMRGTEMNKAYLLTTSMLSSVLLRHPLAFMSETVETVTIKGDDGEPLRINVADFDESKHTRHKSDKDYVEPTQINSFEEPAVEPIAASAPIISDGTNHQNAHVANTDATQPNGAGDGQRNVLLSEPQQPASGGSSSYSVAKFGTKWYVLNSGTQQKAEGEQFKQDGYKTEAEARAAAFPAAPETDGETKPDA